MAGAAPGSGFGFSSGVKIKQGLFVRSVMSKPDLGKKVRLWQRCYIEQRSISRNVFSEMFGLFNEISQKTLKKLQLGGGVILK